MIHKLKTISPYFEAVQSGEKTFEIRRNDRSFQKGDTLILEHFVTNAMLGGSYTGKSVTATVTYVFSNGSVTPLKSGFVVMGIKVEEDPQ